MQSHPKQRISGKAATAEDAFSGLLTEATRRGFYGTIALTLNVQDGSIQQVRITTDRQVR